MEQLPPLPLTATSPDIRKPKMIILVGPPGSGKSTLAAKYEEQGYTRLNQDDQGKGGHTVLFFEALRAGKNIVVDRMNFSVEQRERYLKPARNAGYYTAIQVLQVPHAICLARCQQRVGHPTLPQGDDKSIGDALGTFWSKYERPFESEADIIEFDTRISDPSIPVRRDAIICDLDGTLCNIDHRLHHVRKEFGVRKDWGSFFRDIPGDSVNSWCKSILDRFRKDTEIVFCSGRPDSYRLPTTVWLKENACYPHNLYMRHRKDQREDSIVKEILLDFEILPRYNVLFAIDDRQRVVDMWRRRGIVTLQCAPGNF